MVEKMLARAAGAVDWISNGYRPSARAFGAYRIVFAIYVLLWPRDISWVSGMPAQAFSPPPGPFALLDAPPSAAVISVVAIFQALAAMWVLIGWKTIYASATLSVMLIISSGLVFSFGKVNHSILFDLAPLAFGIAGWGSAWSVDAIRRKDIPVSGYAMFIFGNVIAFVFLYAAAIKARSWWSPGREATHFFIARDVHYSIGTGGPLARWALEIDNVLFWKFIDYSTLFFESWLVVAVFVPGLFRVGLLLLCTFHVGVWLLLGIDFKVNALVYVGFFLAPPSRWFPEVKLLRSLRARAVNEASAPTQPSERAPTNKQG